MIRLANFYSKTDAPISEIDSVAVGISEDQIHDQRHVGIFYRVDEGSHQFIHLAFHHMLEVDQPSEEFFWCIPNLSQRRLKQVAAICRQIAAARPNVKVPYSFGAPSDCFDQRTAEFLLGPTRTGLTCASFVLAVFQQSGLPLVVCESWPKPNDEDVAWQRRVFQVLNNWHDKGRDVSESHLRYVEKEVGTSVRYRPEQVAAAAMLRKSKPLKYARIVRFGRMVCAQIRGGSVKPLLTRFERVLCAIPFLRPKRFLVCRS